MSKFHDEFFRRGSPVHDKLIIKCLSSAGIEKILKSVDFNDALNKTFKQHPADGVYVCTHADGRTCHRNGDDTRPKTGMTHLYEDPLNKYRHTGDRRACNLEATCDKAKSCKWLLTGQDVEYVSIVKDYYATPIKSEYETEVIVKNGQFILGYSDAVISTTYNIKTDAHIDPEWTWKNYSEFSVIGRTIVEVKPKIDSIGDAIRQIKTYHDALYHKYPSDSVHPLMCLVTYDCLEQDALDYLANEHISVVVFEEA
jgi:hypothetical protein